MWINHEFRLYITQLIITIIINQCIDFEICHMLHQQRQWYCLNLVFFLYTKLLMFCLLLIFRCKMPHSGAGSLTGFLSPEKIDGVLSLVGGFCLHLTLGTLYCFGNLNTYMTSYLRKHVHPGIEYSDMIWIPCLATISQVIFYYFFPWENVCDFCKRLYRYF